MTRKAWRPCAKPGCPALVRGGPRCSTHETEADRARGTSYQRGYDTEWQDFRAAHIRDRCQHCDKTAAETGHPLELHHLDGLGPQGPRGFDPTNVITLCKPCHTIETRKGAHR